MTYYRLAAAGELGETECPANGAAAASRVRRRRDGEELAVHARDVHGSVASQGWRGLQRWTSLYRPLDPPVGRDGREATFAAHRVDRPVGTEHRRRRLPTRPEIG